MRFPCELYGPWDPGKSHPANVEVTTERFVFELDDGRQFGIPLEEVRLSRGGFDKLAIVVEGTAEAGEALHAQIREEGFLHFLLAEGPAIIRASASSLQGEGNQTRRINFLAGWVFAIALVAFLLVLWFGFSYLSRQAVEFVPVSVESSLGELTAHALTGNKKAITSGPVFDAVNLVWNRLMAVIPGSPYQYRLYIIESGTVNALAAPGGHVIVYTGLLGSLESAEELAGILAHEVTHVEKRHGVRRLLKSAGVSAILGVVFGDMGSLGELFRGFGADLLNLSYSRKDEKEADLGAVSILREAGIDPRKFPDFFVRFSGKSGNFSKALSIISTHPHGSERDNYLQAAYSRFSKAKFEPLPVDWPKLIAEMKATLPPDALGDASPRHSNPPQTPTQTQ
jgi:Zn-dependent protease with chaperone function